jgi:alkaline phosphatase D
MVAQLHAGDIPFNNDQWDGYPDAQQRFFDMIAPLSDVVVITGDIHSSWAFELANDPFSGSYDPVGVEFVCPSVTAPGFPGNSAAAFMETHPHMKWGELVTHGYMLLDITSERVQCSWWLVDDIENEAAGAETGVAAWSITSGSKNLNEDNSPLPPKESAPDLAP